ncbi:hypothetical protein [Thalassotalea piscium]|uniref:Uncharacterized protein n=1 Tax=Thalassotalea piscium TaxID=1230533 RepID=A0A7X0TUU3_9GAMM|nr:hypothetical protein [Thalassotalea piscium]MBB6544757.1 hypothetical protein [Thalassotalea piscium]
MADLIYIDHEYDGDGNEIEDKYVVELDGKPADEYSLSHDYYNSVVDAHAFAEEVSDQTGVKITWGCLRPAWA